jgi:hypothetical protein
MRSGVGVIALVVGVSAGLLTGCSAGKIAGHVPVGVESPVPSATPVTPADATLPGGEPSNVLPSTATASVVKPPTIAPKSVGPTRTPATTTTKKVVIETRKIAFQRITVQDASLAKGQKVVTTKGVAGTKRLTYELTLVDGVQTRKRLLGQVVVTQQVPQVTSIGSKVAEPSGGGCDPNYTGGCVPIASDVDCAGGSGNGPAYVQGPVKVVGTDIYRLDADHDGIGCEN